MYDDTPDSALITTGGEDAKNFAQAADMLLEEHSVEVLAKKSLKSYEWWLYLSCLFHILLIVLMITTISLSGTLDLKHMVLIGLSVPLLIASCLSYLLAIRGKKRMSEKSTVIFIKLELILAVPLATLMMWFLLDYIGKNAINSQERSVIFYTGIGIIVTYLCKEIFLIRSARRLLKYIHRISIIKTDILSVIGPS